MSLELTTKKLVAEKVNEILGALIDSLKEVQAGLSVNIKGEGSNLGVKTTTTQSPATTAKAPTKKEIAELKKTAKASAGLLLKEFGKEAGRVKLSELLALFGASKFTDLQEDAHIFEDFTAKAGVLLGQKPEAATADDDLLGDGPATEPTKVYTAEDVRDLALQVQTKHGKKFMRQLLLAELGVQRLPELKKEKFAAAVSLLETELAKDVDPLGAE